MYVSECGVVTYELCLCVYVMLLCICVCPLRSIGVVRILGRGVGLSRRGISLGQSTIL